MVGDLAIDPAARVANLDGEPLDLTRKEFDLLHYLAQRPDTVVSKQELLAEVWRQPYGGADKTIDVHLSWLRRKLGETAAEPRLPPHGPRRGREAGRTRAVRRRLIVVAGGGDHAAVALAFLLPLALLVRRWPRDRALADARAEARAVATVLVGDLDDGAATRRCSRSTQRRRPPRGPSGAAARRRRPVATPCRPATTRVARALGGAAFADQDAAAAPGPTCRCVAPTADRGVVAAFVARRLLQRGVARSWRSSWCSAGLLVLGRRRRRPAGPPVVRPVTELAATAAGGWAPATSTPRVTPAGPPEVEARRARAQPAGRPDPTSCWPPSASWSADLSHRLRTPLTALRLDAEAYPDASWRSGCADTSTAGAPGRPHHPRRPAAR